MNAPIRVLVVDDEPPIRKLLRMGLGTQGYEIIEAPNGRAALDLLAQEPAQMPALIILDLGLPDMQGLELLRLVRARHEGIAIVVLSSRGDEAGKVQALDLGADDYVTKPFGMGELLAPHARGAAPPAADPGRAPGIPRRRPLGRPGAADRQGARRGGEAVAQGIRPASPAGAARRQGC